MFVMVVFLFQLQNVQQLDIMLSGTMATMYLLPLLIPGLNVVSTLIAFYFEELISE